MDLLAVQGTLKSLVNHHNLITIEWNCKEEKKIDNYVISSSLNTCTYAEILGEIEENFLSAAAAAKSLQSCPILCYPIDSSPQGSPVPGILQARTLEWVAISFSNA